MDTQFMIFCACCAILVLQTGDDAEHKGKKSKRSDSWLRRRSRKGGKWNKARKTRLEKAIEEARLIEAIDGGFKVPFDYDYSLTTNANYKVQDLAAFRGQYADLRAKIEYGYHVNYQKARQLWQDEVINSVVRKTAPQASPWIVYTCGPMGAGKGYALDWMSENGFFPLANIVHVDPDHFKAVMPEWRGYVDRDSATAGSQCHRESGFIQEIAQEVAMKNNQNVWVDGSLRDGKWFSLVYDDIRARFPKYRIAIFYVFASEDKIRERVKLREIKTGRGVPEAELVDSMNAPDRSLGMLVNKVDFIARINNNGAVPVLDSFSQLDTSGAWNALKSRFARTQASPSEFPSSLAPLALHQVALGHAMFQWTPAIREQVGTVGGQELSRVRLRNACFNKTTSPDLYGAPLSAEVAAQLRKQLGFTDSEEGRKALKMTQALLVGTAHTLELTLSPVFPVTVDPETRKLAGIPLSAATFCYCYGPDVDERAVRKLRMASTDGPLMNDQNAAFPFVNFLVHGGFMYFDVNREVCGALAIIGTSTLNLIQFGPGLSLNTAQSLHVCGVMDSRLAPVTIAHMKAAGATRYGWVFPGESFGTKLKNPHGGFAYEFHESVRFFPVLGVSDDIDDENPMPSAPDEPAREDSAVSMLEPPPPPGQLLPAISSHSLSSKRSGRSIDRLPSDMSLASLPPLDIPEKYPVLRTSPSSAAKKGTDFGFVVPADFDYSKSTNDNYKDDNLVFHGQYTDIRDKIEYGYHVNYTKERQLLQDAVINSVVHKTTPQASPWVVYTCGPMGAGKGYALNWMSENGFFPLANIVHVDPDHFKSVMPEWQGYVDRDSATAGSQCHRESGFIQEIAQEVAMKNNQNVWVDGSLRDGKWFSLVYDDIRARFPKYRIAIFYVFASEDKIRERVKLREIKTGRGVPEAELVDSMNAPDRSLGMLVNKVDFIARINNNGAVPVLASFEQVDTSKSWNVLKTRFARTQASPSEFPKSLAPFPLHPLGLNHAMFKWTDPQMREACAVGGKTLSKVVMRNEFFGRIFADVNQDGILDQEEQRALDKYDGDGDGELDIAEQTAMLADLGLGGLEGDEGKKAQRMTASLIEPGHDLELTLSPVFPVTVDPETRKLAGIPLAATTFCFCYGPRCVVPDAVRRLRMAGENGPLMNAKNPAHSFVNFLVHGGFVYFDVDRQVCGALSIVASHTTNMIQYGPGVSLDPLDSAHVIKELNQRLVPVTIAHMKEAGATRYGWLFPGETFSTNLKNVHGGFAYEMSSERRGISVRFFPVLGVSDDFHEDEQ